MKHYGGDKMRQCNDSMNNSIAKKGPGARAHKPVSTRKSTNVPRKGVSNRGR